MCVVRWWGGGGGGGGGGGEEGVGGGGGGWGGLAKPLISVNDCCTSSLSATYVYPSQDQLDQIENDCTSIEEDLLQRQIEQETTSTHASPASSMELPATQRKKESLLEKREKFQTTSDAMQPIVNVFYLQLQLLQNIQDGRELVAKAMDFVGEQGELEALYTEVEVG